MDRLTERDEFGNADIIGVDSGDLMLNLGFENFNKVTDALNKLAEYEDIGIHPEQIIEVDRLYAEKCMELAELQKSYLSGLKLPCAVGDIVYALWRVTSPDKHVIYPAEVKEICLGRYFSRKTKKYKLEPISYRGRILNFYDDDFEKLFFLTKEEAEAALQKMNETEESKKNE